MRRHSWLLALVILAFPALLSAQAPPAPQTQAPQTQTPARGGNAGRGGAQGAPAAPLQISTDLTGWKSMFDGVSLKGWDGPMPLWHVENGTIAVRRTLDPPLGCGALAGMIRRLDAPRHQRAVKFGVVRRKLGRSAKVRSRARQDAQSGVRFTPLDVNICSVRLQFKCA